MNFKILKKIGALGVLCFLAFLIGYTILFLYGEIRYHDKVFGAIDRVYLLYFSIFWVVLITLIFSIPYLRRRREEVFNNIAGFFCFGGIVFGVLFSLYYPGPGLSILGGVLLTGGFFWWVFRFILFIYSQKRKEGVKEKLRDLQWGIVFIICILGLLFLKIWHIITYPFRKVWANIRLIGWMIFSVSLMILLITSTNYLFNWLHEKVILGELHERVLLLRYFIYYLILAFPIWYYFFEEKKRLYVMGMVVFGFILASMIYPYSPALAINTGNKIAFGLFLGIYFFLVFLPERKFILNDFGADIDSKFSSYLFYGGGLVLIISGAYLSSYLVAKPTILSWVTNILTDPTFWVACVIVGIFSVLGLLAQRRVKGKNSVSGY